MWYHLTNVSRNVKTGPIPVTTISNDTCPEACPLKDNGCYAETGPLGLHWRNVTSQRLGMDFDSFVKAIRRLPEGVWRYAQAGDLPGSGDVIDEKMTTQLAKANRRRPVIAFTHKPLTGHNVRVLKEVEALGFHVNASANSPKEADEILQKDLSAVTILPSEYGRLKKESLSDYRKRLRTLELRTPKGKKIAICPATYTDTNCQQCRACAKRRVGDTVIGFPAHGTRSKVVDQLIHTKENHEQINEPTGVDTS